MELEPGEFGLRAVPKGHWEARQQAYCMERQIHELHFNHAKGYQSTGSYGFLADWPGLLGLKVLDPLLEDLDFLAAQPALRALDLSFTGKIRRGIDLQRLPRLERLTLLSRFSGMESLFGCTGLRRLALAHFPGKMTSAMLAPLAGLEELWLSALVLPELDALAGFKALERLSISGDRSLASLAGLAGASALRHLTLESCPQIGSLAALASLSRLETLWLYDCGRLESLQPLSACRQLRELNILGNTSIADGQLGLLRDLPQLQRVCIVAKKHYQPAAADVNRG
ncbi:leucine-rich repeat domain-containing protein [Pseudoduganella violacea]|uniref:Leucine-rich repeat domain-containing protein n=1 Tax=Pseudoduganella violacea TaxID=1715466 RepID=A0A7W5BCR6_9BURK|nr:leucine-rich repeat domain-containing protein [Pseudoduganella violacea]MBB3120794.1 hypothetical protein [Pseudoduganella violacea]